MLNIGRLGTDLDAVVEYYTADVDDHDAPSVQPSSQPAANSSATSNYYVNAKNPGRWVGTLRSELGVDGGVDADAFRRLLEGCHPITGEPLTPGARTAQNKQHRYQQRNSRNKRSETLTVNEAALRLGLNGRHVRRLLERGAALDDESTKLVWSYLRGTKLQKNVTGPGRAVWQIPVAEVERFEEARESASMRPGFDLTLRPPKSVSIMWSLGRPEWSAIVASAHREAVDEVIDYYESAAIFSRKRVEGEQLRIETGGLIGAAFDHRTSRAGDPLLHTHVVVFNTTRCVDGEWRSLDGTPIYEHAKTAGYLYQAHLRHVLSRELGVKWTEVVPIQTDEVFRPLIRLAKTDDLAARTILQAMMPGLRATVRRYGWADDHSELIAMTIASGFEQIRRYPIDRRPNRIAANILLDTKRTLHDRFVQMRAAEEPSADLDVRVIPAAPHPADNVSSVVSEAVRRGVVSTSDGRLIVETRVFDVTFDEIAARHDLNANSLRRRRQRAEATIREADLAMPS